MSVDSGPGQREVAHRLFAAEFEDSELEYADSEEERAPKYVVTPTGARVNRLFVVGVLTEVESVTDEVLRARVVDPTGAFVVYAGQYQPEAMAFFDRATPPMFVAITGKANTFSPEDSDRVYTSIRPESVTEVDAETRDRWTVAAAEHTIGRVSAFAEAYERLESAGSPAEARRALEADGMETTRAAGLALAHDHYGTTPPYLASMREAALDAARLVAGEVDEVERPSLAPDEGGSVDLGALRSPEVDAATPVQSAGEPGSVSEVSGGAETPAEQGSDDTPSDGASSEAAPESEVTQVSDQLSEPDTAPERGSDEPEPVGEPGDPSPERVEPDTVEAETSDPSDAAEPAEPSGWSAGEGAVTESTGTDSTARAGTDVAPESVPAGTDDPVGRDGEETSTEAEVDSDPSEPATDPGETPAEVPDTDDDLDDFEPSGAEDVGMYEMSDEEREEVESEFGTEFETGSEVDDPGEADIDVPEPEPAVDDDEATETGGGPDEGDGDESEAAVNVENEAMDAMRALSDGDGAEREAIVSRVAEEHGVTPETVEDAITDALMSGRCYEPRDGVLKPI
ncbi:hypothetical protein [Natronorarus salvus]|uniref:hypothetical protein n=1 Tax=Natronorarus salvus TaxID=3117733 RepID=UPI002F267C3E